MLPHRHFSAPVLQCWLAVIKHFRARLNEQSGSVVVLSPGWCLAARCSGSGCPCVNNTASSELFSDLIYSINNNKRLFFFISAFSPSFLREALIGAKRSDRWQTLKPRGEEHTAPAMKFRRLIYWSCYTPESRQVWDVSWGRRNPISY